MFFTSESILLEFAILSSIVRDTGTFPSFMLTFRGDGMLMLLQYQYLKDDCHYDHANIEGEFTQQG